ncbi:MAG: hypothetical protein IPL84_00005 [Chitinophagaceae bacterium]|nr:hypothetical protein [Chitinophagaceae bacterium]
MTALAVKELFKDNPDDIKSMELLSTGTSTPDQLMPSHGVMVHGWLPETNPVEVVSPSGVCCAGMHAFKYAYLSTKAGRYNNLWQPDPSAFQFYWYPTISKMKPKD